MVERFTHTIDQATDFDIGEVLREFGPTETLRIEIKARLEHTDIHDDEHIFLNHEILKLSREQRKKIFETSRNGTTILEHILQAGIESGEFQIDDVSLVAQWINSCCSIWALRRWAVRKLCTLEQYTEKLTEFFLNCIESKESVDQKSSSKSGG